MLHNSNSEKQWMRNMMRTVCSLSVSSWVITHKTIETVDEEYDEDCVLPECELLGYYSQDY